jgi:hypothetical protein
MNAPATSMAVVPGSRLSFSARRRTRRATCAEWPLRSARDASRRLTSTLSSSTNEAPETPLSDGAAGDPSAPRLGAGAGAAAGGGGVRRMAGAGCAARCSWTGGAGARAGFWGATGAMSVSLSMRP